MNKDKLRRLLEQVKSGNINIDETIEKMRHLPYEDLEFAKIDTHRNLRRGFPEVIFCQGKTSDQVRAIVERMLNHSEIVLGMRADNAIYQAVKDVSDHVAYNKMARAIIVGERPEIKNKGTILVVSAGTADMPVAEEAVVTAEIMGNRVEKLYDVGVAGIHRILNNQESLYLANVIVVVAGMEGALPGVIGGLVDKPVVAVPTSVGYGANFNGLSALLTMLNSCVPGIGVVNIDNGFGGGYLANLMNRLGEGEK